MGKKTASDSKRIKQLTTLIQHHQEQYHTHDAPEISDEAYDSLVRELRDLTGETGPHEQVAIGATVSEAFSKVTHQVRQWSFSNVFTDEELQEWEDRLYRHLVAEDHAGEVLEYVAEHKIDGLKVILEYQAGKLVRAATRGDGVVGEDVTHTVRTIADIPEILTHPVDLQAVGEVWLGRTEFERINHERSEAGESLFANPRNAAAGSLRQLDETVTAGRKLEVFVYDIDVFQPHATKLDTPTTQWAELQLLKQLGLRTNPHSKQCKKVADIIRFHTKWSSQKDTLDYGVDGVVIKVNAITQQTWLGYTAKAPRFGTAFKFKAEQATTVVEDIQLQVGRTGAITPVAHLRPVFIDGSTVSRATLHNEDQIKRLDVRVGDTVILQKAGDIIPEILEVLLDLRPQKTKSFSFPKTVEGCGGDGTIERVPGEAAYRCVTLDSDFLHRQRLYHFVSKGALNIDGVGPRIIDLLLDHNLINDQADLFTLEVGDLRDLPGFKDKAAENVISAVNQVRTIALHRLLIGLSIDQVGEETARLLADKFGTLSALENAKPAEIAAVYGVGEIVAEAVIAWFANKKNQTLLKRLLEQITIEEQSAGGNANKFVGQSIVFTGTLPTLGRDEAKDLARSVGFSVSSSVSKKTDYVVVGADPGSKADKASELGRPILDEAAFLKLVR